MTISKTVGALLATSIMAFAAPAFAQEQAPAAEAAAPTAEETAAQTAFLAAQVESLQSQIEALKKQMSTAAPSWKGAPQWADTGAGWTFKPKGVIQFDAGYITSPSKVGLTGLNATIGGVNTNNLGFNYRARRLIVGVEGTIPGDFFYKFELQLSQGTVDYEDMVIGYQKAGSPWSVTLGYQYPLSSLELLTSNRFTSFMERAANTDAFNYNRRVGGTLAYTAPTGEYGLAAGLYGNETINNTSFVRTSWQASVRGYWSPKFGETQAHLGFQYQHRVQPRDAQNVSYGIRPYTQITDQKFINTGAIAADGDDILGGELAAIHNSLHMASEWQHVWVRGYAPGRGFGVNNGAGAGAVFYTGKPQFDSGYFELGYFLTGETRGYKGGKWDRTKVLHPFNSGGMGAVQVNGRVDYTNLRDQVAPGTINTATNYVNGGRSIGYEASLIWLPIDYVKFMLQYAHSDITGGKAAVAPFASTVKPIQDRSYGVDAVTMRAQLDF
jgi:phosphate-selective porin OprO/OprP